MKKLLVTVVLVNILVGCSISQVSSTQPVEKWNNYTSSKISDEVLKENQAVAVFYRQDDAVGQAVNVFVNEDYQTSLLENAYSAVAVCADKQLFSTSLSTNQKFGNRTEGLRQTLPVGNVAYFKVINDNGQPRLMSVEESVAQQEMMDLPRMNQTLSRVKTPSECGAPVLQTTNLSAEALFPFNKSSYESILSEGKEQITDFVKKANELDPQMVSKVVVSGHTDPVGSEKYNNRLSQRRAEAVKKALMNGGINFPVEAVGYGESELVVVNCAIKHKGKAITECNLPNRRVEVTVYGNK